MTVLKTFHEGWCEYCVHVSPDLIKCRTGYKPTKFVRRSKRKCNYFEESKKKDNVLK